MGYRRSGRVHEALNAVEAVLSAARRNDERLWERELHRLRGLVILEAEGPNAKVTRAFSRSLAVTRAQHAASLELRAVLSVARLKLLQGERNGALQIGTKRTQESPCGARDL